VEYLYLSKSGVSDYTSTTIPNTWKYIFLQDLGLTSTEVDNFIIDLEDGAPADGTLVIGGTNAARTSASDDEVTSLENDGWTITVNE